MEGIHTLKDLIKPGDWLTKVDLKDTYFTITIHHSHRRFVRFVWEGTACEFSCPPFGLSSALWVITKTLKLAAALLQGMRVHLIIYIDDMLILSETREKVKEYAETLVYLLHCLGFVLNQKKSVLVVARTMDFLGFTMDTVLMQLRLPGKKLNDIRAEAQKVARDKMVSGRALSWLIGKMNGISQVIPLAPLFFRHLQMTPGHWNGVSRTTT